MASVRWQYNYRFSGQYRYYGSGRPAGHQDLPLEAFVVDHLNTSRQKLILGMSNIRRKSEATVRRMSRVDTGNMQKLVTGTGDFGTDVLKIEFGWREMRPYYAPFQEFGTRTIQPMMAVHTAFRQAVPDVQRLVR